MLRRQQDRAACAQPFLKSPRAGQQLKDEQRDIDFNLTTSEIEANQQMTITHSVQQEFLDDETKNLICIPCHPNVSSVNNAQMAANVRLRVSTLVQQPLPHTPPSLLQGTLSTPPSPNRTAESTKGERWTEDEHERFLLGMELFKAGPWKKIASVVGTRDARQTMSHAQKYRQKIKRRKLGLPTPEHPRHDTNSDATSTKRVRTARTLERTSGSEAENRVVGNARSHVSPRVQLPREALDNGERGTTGPISTETIPTAANDAHTLDGVLAARVGRLNQLDAALEPLDIDASVSMAQDSWLGPDELWDFLDGRAAPGPAAGGNQRSKANQPSQVLSVMLLRSRSRPTTTG